MEAKQWIIFGAGQTGKAALYKYGEEHVHYFCDNYITGEYYGKRVLNINELESIWNTGSFSIDIAIDSVDAAFDIKEQLRFRGMHYEHWSGESTISRLLLRVRKNGEDIEFVYDSSSPHAWRMQATIQMLLDMFEEYGSDLDDDIDLIVYAADDVYEADKIRQLLKKEKICAYSTVYGFDDVIAIPDYKYVLGFIDGESYYGNAINKLKRFGEKAHIDNRAFWAGNLENDKTRLVLKKLGEQHPDKLFIYDFIYRNGEIQYEKKPLSAKQFMDYKYLIDIRGFGWTDRVKYLLGMKRPLLLVDRPFKEYYFDQLIPMKHYVPIREDLSDLLEKIQTLESDEELYNSIRNNAFEYVQSNFTKEKIRKVLYKCAQSGG